MTERLLVCGTSRSGTTLLCTVLDAHPLVAMGNELMPGGLGDIHELIGVLESAVASDERPARWIRRQHGRAGPFKLLVNATFVGVGAPGLLDICREAAERGIVDLDDAGNRALLATAILDRKRVRAGASAIGFKVNTMALAGVHRAVPDGRFVLIVRDPRDVAASQLERFGRAPAGVAQRWSGYHRAFLDLPSEASTIAIRYEDLVADFDGTVGRVLDLVGLEVTDEVRSFAASDAGILGTRNFNAGDVASGLYGSSVGRGSRELRRSDRRAVERVCRPLMRRFGY